MSRRKARSTASPVEEILADVRGQIVKLQLAGVKVNLLFSKAMSVRSGDWHVCRQYDIVLSGEVEIQYGVYERSRFKTLKPGELFVLPPRTPHLFRFQKDTVMLEWWDGSFRAWYYKPYRKEVEKCLRWGGKFAQLAGSQQLRRKMPCCPR